MIRIDRKVCKDILNITNSYNVSILYDPEIDGYAIWHHAHVDRAEFKSSIHFSEVPLSLARLEERGLIRKVNGLYNGGMVFRITPELLHAKSFWFDSFSKKFIGGFVTGVITGLTANLLTGPVQSMLSSIFQWIHTLK